MALAAFAGPVAGMPLFGWPAPVAGIAAALSGIDRTGRPRDRTPLLHSPPAAAGWTVAGWALALALAPEHAPGAALAVACGLGASLVLDAFEDGELYLWPATRSPAEWLLPRKPGSTVMLGEEMFSVPTADGAVPRDWAGWRVLGFRQAGVPRRGRNPAVDMMARHTDMLLSAGSLLALLLAVVLK
jgi:hypothetical protein